MADKVRFDILRGDVNQVTAYASDSAKLQGKTGCMRFDNQCSEVSFFVNAATFHCNAVQNYHKAVIKRDEAYERQASHSDQIIMESSRPDVRATIFEFNAWLLAVRSLFDRLPRMLEPPFDSEMSYRMTPFLRITNQTIINDPLYKHLRDAWNNFGLETKKYRDCLVHYSLFREGIVRIFGMKQKGKRELLLPDNPEARSAGSFQYQKRIKLVNFSKEVTSNVIELVWHLSKGTFEKLVREEFRDDKVTIKYWNALPNTPPTKLKRNHHLEVAPGLARSGDQYARMRVEVSYEDGSLQMFRGLPLDRLQDMPKGDLSLSGTSSATSEIETAIAVHRMYLNEKRRKRGLPPVSPRPRFST